MLLTCGIIGKKRTEEFPQAKASDDSNGAIGHAVNSRRSCLLPEYVNMSVFLADNLKQINRTSQTIVILHVSSILFRE